MIYVGPCSAHVDPLSRPRRSEEIIYFPSRSICLDNSPMLFNICITQAHCCVLLSHWAAWKLADTHNQFYWNLLVLSSCEELCFRYASWFPDFEPRIYGFLASNQTTWTLGTLFRKDHWPCTLWWPTSEAWTLHKPEEHATNRHWHHLRRLPRVSRVFSSLPRAISVGGANNAVISLLTKRRGPKRHSSWGY